MAVLPPFVVREELHTIFARVNAPARFSHKIEQEIAGERLCSSAGLEARLQPQHQLQVLDCGARGTFAKVVEARHKKYLSKSIVAEDEDLQIIGTIERFVLEARPWLLGKRLHLYMALTGMGL